MHRLSQALLYLPLPKVFQVIYSESRRAGKDNPLEVKRPSCSHRLAPNDNSSLMRIIILS